MSRWLVLAFMLAVTGCYRSHERSADRDAGARPADSGASPLVIAQPPFRYGSAVVDPRTGMLYSFGGTASNATWAVRVHGDEATLETTTRDSPPAFVGGSRITSMSDFVWDTRRGRGLLARFGGRDEDGAFFAFSPDTRTWSRMPWPRPPNVAAAAQLFVDPGADRLISVALPDGEVWTLDLDRDGASWQSLARMPGGGGPLVHGAIALDAIRRRLLFVTSPLEGSSARAETTAIDLATGALTTIVDDSPRGFPIAAAHDPVRDRFIVLEQFREVVDLHFLALDEPVPTWRSVTDLPLPILGAATALREDGNALYFYGGEMPASATLPSRITSRLRALDLATFEVRAIGDGWDHPLVNFSPSFVYDDSAHLLRAFGPFSYATGEMPGSIALGVAGGEWQPQRGGRTERLFATANADGALLAFGGVNDTTELGTLDRLVDGAWTNVTTIEGRLGASLSWDPTNREAVIGMGTQSGFVHRDPHVFDDVVRIALETGEVRPLVVSEPRPPARWGHVGAVDAARRRLVIFGGDGGGFAWGSALLRDTWTIDLDTGVATRAADGPELRMRGWALDVAQDRLWIVGGPPGAHLGEPHLYYLDLASMTWTQACFGLEEPGEIVGMAATEHGVATITEGGYVRLTGAVCP